MVILNFIFRENRVFFTSRSKQKSLGTSTTMWDLRLRGIPGERVDQESESGSYYRGETRNKHNCPFNLMTFFAKNWIYSQCAFFYNVHQYVGTNKLYWNDFPSIFLNLTIKILIRFPSYFFQKNNPHLHDVWVQTRPLGVAAREPEVCRLPPPGDEPVRLVGGAEVGERRGGLHLPSVRLKVVPVAVTDEHAWGMWYINCRNIVFCVKYEYCSSLKFRCFFGTALKI